MKKYPIIVDLDKTLIKNDLFQELFFNYFLKKPITSIISLFKNGVLKTKKKLLIDENLKEINIIPNENLIHSLKNEHEKGRDIYLVTASTQNYASKIKSIYPFFKEVYGSTDINLKGQHKINFIKENISSEFDYYGDSFADKIIFKEAQNYLKINTFKFINLIKLMRIKHWLKNILIFIPILLTPDRITYDNLLNLCVGFFTFSLTASFGYVFNDLIDFESDRNHPIKKGRPIASGDIGVKESILTLFSILVLIIFLASTLVNTSLVLLISYFVINLSYSFKLKEIKWLDVLLLSSFYLIRLLFGGSITSIEISYWLLFTSFFAFFFLSIDKRLNELLNSKKNNSRRAYRTLDINTLNTLRISSALFCAFIYNFFLYEELTHFLEYKNYILMLSFLISLYIQLTLLDDKEEDLVKKITTNKSIIIGLLFLAAIYFYVKF